MTIYVKIRHMNSFYSSSELSEIGFKAVGKNVLVSRKCSIYNAEQIILGDNVRIDDFCLLTGNIKIGSYVHISAFSALYGAGGIIIGNYCGLSPRSIIFSATDDFSGESMISPMVPEELTNVKKETVFMEDFSQLGASTVVMPGVSIKEGAVTGINTLVKDNLEEWTINAGTPAHKLKNREKKAKELLERINYV